MYLLFRYLQIIDATDSINVVICNSRYLTNEAMIGKIVKVKTPQKIISEWSVVCGTSWDTMYLTIDYNDITIERHEIVAKEPDKDKQNYGEQKWKVLYASHPTFHSRKEHPSIYVAVRKMAKYTNQLHSPQSNFDNDATNNPIRFIELPLGKIPSAILVTPGTILRTKSKHYDEKYLAILHTHVNKLLKLNPQFNVKRYVSIFLLIVRT